MGSQTFSFGTWHLAVADLTTTTRLDDSSYFLTWHLTNARF
jgi:hypothetical protein